MFEVFIKYLSDKANLTGMELARIKSLSIPKKLRKRQYLLQEGDVCIYGAFICKGCLRIYRVSEDGTEHIMRFAVENWWASDRESYTTGLPSKCNIDALEDSEILLWTKDNFETLLNEIPEFKAFSERLLAGSFNSAQRRIYAGISNTAEEKYNDFIRLYPEIFNRVPLHMVASYLGISRETLSRIRSQFAHK
jgi:CRP-like cAMP-binding protein